jgi:hypothetical protein
MATDSRGIHGYGPRRRGTVEGAIVKSFLILFAAVAPPALLYAALSETDFAAVRELAPWALMLLGFGGMAVALRARERPRRPVSRERSRRAAARQEGVGAGAEPCAGGRDARTWARDFGAVQRRRRYVAQKA